MRGFHHPGDCEFLTGESPCNSGPCVGEYQCLKDVCPECRLKRPDDERVINGMKCAKCTGY